MTIPEDENTPQPPEGGTPAGAVPPAPEPTAPPVPPVVPPTAPPAGGFPPAPPAAGFPPAAGSVPPPAGAFPGYAATPPPPVERPTGIPTPVNAAFWLFIASAALSVISGVIALATIGGSRQSIINAIQRQGGTVHGQSIQTLADAAVAVAITVTIVTLIFWALTFVLFAVFMRRGANWARIVLTVLTAVSLLNILAGRGVGALQVLAAVVAVVLIWLRPSTAWFAAIKASKAPRA